jgi:hypothetical protein
MVQNTGAQDAQIDTRIFKGQIAAATGVPVHQLGDNPTSGLSTLASLDGPMHAMIEDLQDDWKTVIADIVGYMLAGEGYDPRRVIVKMPPILMRDVQSASPMLIGAMSAFDPNGSNRELQRWVMGQILELLGDPDPQQVVDDILPPGYETPYEQHHRELVPQGHGGRSAARDSASGGGGDRRFTPARIAARVTGHAAERAQVQRNQGLRGIPAPGESLDRAQRRVELAREASVSRSVLDGFDEQLREATHDAFDMLSVTR